MDKFAGETYVKSDASYDGYYKNKDCNRSQIKVSQDVYVPMEGHIYSDRLENGTYENDDVFCNACYAYRHDDFKRLYSDLSQDIYVPIEVAYNFMNRLSYGTYGNGNVFSITCSHHKDNHCEGLQRNMSEDAYVSLDACSSYLDENSIENLSQTLVPLVPTDTKKPIEYITGENNIYKKKLATKIKNFAKKEPFRIKTKKPTNKKQFRPLSEGFNQILSLNPDPEDAKRCYSEIYDVPNTRPMLPNKIEQNKESAFRSRSNACVSQNLRTYLKETKSAGI